MERTFDPGAMLSRTYALPNGPRVRLRMPQASDATNIRLLSDGALSDLELSRLIRHDPRQRLVICATTFVAGREAVVGVGALSLDRPPDGPEVLFADSAAGERLPELIRD